MSNILFHKTASRYTGIWDRILIYYHYDLLDNDIDLDQHEPPEHAKIIAKPLHPNL